MNTEMNEIGELHATSIAYPAPLRQPAGRKLKETADRSLRPEAEFPARISLGFAYPHRPRCAPLDLLMRFHHRSGGSADASLTIDAVPSFSYKPPMICAFPRLMTTADSRGFAVGPEGMRVR